MITRSPITITVVLGYVRLRHVSRVESTRQLPDGWRPPWLAANGASRRFQRILDSRLTVAGSRARQRGEYDQREATKQGFSPDAV